MVQAEGSTAEVNPERLEQVLERVLVSAEHGIGLDKLRWLPHSRSDAEIGLMRLMKRSLDPYNILNRGRVLSA